METKRHTAIVEAIEAHTRAAAVDPTGPDGEPDHAHTKAWHLLCSLVELYRENDWSLKADLRDVEETLAAL